MTDKAYIVANKQQEIEVLKKLERKGVFWRVGRSATNFVPSENNTLGSFPYAIIEKEFIIWSLIEQLEDETIVYDGRKEEKMYKVTQEFMDLLTEWRDEYTKSIFGVNAVSLTNMPEIVRSWRFGYNSSIETNKRLGAIIDWINGEDVFEVEASHKFVVRSDKKDHDGCYAYVAVENDMTTAAYTFVNATKFDTREEAQEWANSHQVVIEIDTEGNEVE